ncbi:MAG: hypothetical protein AAGI09_12655 [Pseudomonadota bacterium]
MVMQALALRSASAQGRDIVRVSPRLLRWIAAGPVALIATFAVMGGMALWWPKGPAGLDHIAMPIVLFPMIWVGWVTYGVIADLPGRALGVMAGVTLGNCILIAIG